jgi:hypothetical protein
MDYLLIDHTGLCVNAIRWDGVSPFTPPAGVSVIPVPDDPPGVWIGWTLNPDGSWSPPSTPEAADDPELVQ